MIDVLSLAEQDTRLRKASAKEQAGPCPDTSCRCQTDGFRVKWTGEKWVFMCRGCWDSQEFLAERERKRGWGDEIDYLRHYRKMSFNQAKAFLGEQCDDTPIVANHQAPILGMNYQTDEWQRKTDGTMKKHVDRLWDEDDTTALEYARIRGFTDDTIRQARFGYSLKDGIPCLIVPSINDSAYVAVSRRDLRPGIEVRWKDAPGGTKSELYLADSLKRKMPTILCEDAFSAISVWQEARDLVNVVATCGATCSKHVKWVARLARQPLVLVALDADEDGDANATWWFERLPNARRLRPLLKDINDMLMQQWDIREWIEQALQEDEPLLCSVCGVSAEETEDFYYGEDGMPLCAVHFTSSPTVADAATTVGTQERMERFAHLLGKQKWAIGCTTEVMHCTPQEYISRRSVELDEEAWSKPRWPSRLPHRECIPTWLIPGSTAWNEHVEFLSLGPKSLLEDMKTLGLRPQMTREGAITDMQARRTAWIEQHQERQERAS